MKKIIMLMLIFVTAAIAQTPYTVMNLDGRTTDSTTSWLWVMNERAMPRDNFIIEGAWNNATGTFDGDIEIYGSIDPVAFASFNTTASGVLLQTIAIDTTYGSFAIELENRGWKALKFKFDVNTLDSADVLIKTNMRDN